MDVNSRGKIDFAFEVINDGANREAIIGTQTPRDQDGTAPAAGGGGGG